HAAGVKGDDLVVEAGETPAVLGDQGRIKPAVPIARNRQLHRPFGRQDGLGAAAVAVVGEAGCRLVLQVNVQLGAQHAFGQSLLQVPDQAARIQYRLGITASQQLVQKLCRKCLRIVLGHTSSSPSRAVYGSSHKNPDTPVELAHVPLNIPGAHAAGVKGDDLVVEAGETPAVLGDQGRIKP